MPDPFEDVPTGGGGGSPAPSAPAPSAPAAAPVDQYISDTFRQDAVKRQKAQSFAQVYAQLWGEPATEDYIVKAVNAGFNVWEFREAEMSKPAFQLTKTYQDEFAKWSGLLHQMGVM